MATTFRLQTLLNYRKNLEELSQIRLAERQQDLFRQEERLEHLRESRAACYREFNHRAAEPAPLGELAFYLEYQDLSHDRLGVLDEGRKKILAELDQERDRLMALTKDRKILEKLKENQQRDLEKAVNRKERKELENLVVQRFASLKTGR